MSMTTEQKQNLLAYLGLYNKDGIDGVYGSLTREATRAFQISQNLEPDGDFGPATEAAILKVIGSGIKSIKTSSTNTTIIPNTTTTTVTNINTNNTGVFAGIKNFNEKEFTCKCNGRHCKGNTATMSRILLEEADLMREKLGVVVVTSGIRCPVHNANEGGVSNSRHLSGKAMDFYIVGKSANQIESYLNDRPRIRYHYTIEGTNNRCVHMDVD